MGQHRAAAEGGGDPGMDAQPAQVAIAPVIAGAARRQALIEQAQDADQGRGGKTGGIDDDALVPHLPDLALKAGQVFDGQQVGYLGADLDPVHGIGRQGDEGPQGRQVPVLAAVVQHQGTLEEQWRRELLQPQHPEEVHILLPGGPLRVVAQQGTEAAEQGLKGLGVTQQPDAETPQVQTLLLPRRDGAGGLEEIDGRGRFGAGDAIGRAAPTPLAQGIGVGVAQPAGGFGHEVIEPLQDGPRLRGGSGDPQPGRQLVGVANADAPQVLRGGTPAPFQDDATGGLGILQQGVEGVAFAQVPQGEVGVGGTLADRHGVAPAPVHLGQELEQQGAGDLGGAFAAHRSGRGTGLSAARAWRAAALICSVSMWTLPPSR